MAKGIREVTNGLVQPARSLAIARTESTAISNEARFAAMTSAGVGKKKRVTANDEHVRTSHQENGLQDPVPMNEPFQNGLMFPGDTSLADGAGEVVNCRCAVRAVVDPSTQDSAT